MTPYKAYCYGISRGPSKETREIVYQSPGYTYLYALYVDQCPRDDTRNAACKTPGYAYLYAKDVDKCFHEDTWAAVKNTEYEEKYITLLNFFMKEEII
jgi:hypothetical protein